MKLNDYIKKGIMVAFMAVVCITVTARPHYRHHAPISHHPHHHYHHRHHVAKAQTAIVVADKPVVKVTKKPHRKGTVKKVVITKVYKR